MHVVDLEPGDWFRDEEDGKCYIRMPIFKVVNQPSPRGCTGFYAVNLRDGTPAFLVLYHEAYEVTPIKKDDAAIRSITR